MFRRNGAAKVDRDPRELGRLRSAGRRYMQSRATFVGSMVFVLVLLAAAIYLIVVPAPQPRSGPTEAGGESAPPLIAAPPPPPAAAELCADQEPVEVLPEVLLSTTFSTAWVESFGAPVPESDTARPTHTDWPRQCFPRSPEGALYSVATLLNAANAANAADTLSLAEARFSRTGGYQRQMAALQAAGGSTITGTQPQMAIIGYRWAGYTPLVATLELQWVYLSGPTADTTKAITYQLVWESNDWLTVVPTNRSALYRDGAESRTFTPWGPS